MRRLMVIGAVMVGVTAMGPALAQVPASGKIMAAWACAAPDPAHMIPVGDEPDHMYGVEQGKCTAKKGEVGGVPQKEGTYTEFMEGMGKKVTGHGVFVETLSNGDKLVYTYTFTGMSDDKMMVSGTNKWTITSGTGKFKGIKGSGTCTGKGNPDRSADYTCSGTYTIGK